ncbi:hypothetical protein TrST_g11514 [Triparma strigata]|uniref:Uncharacterized protein n=1 Tax=Triparma strigata TaxID=1606541 RepID=A0A9W6ZYR4_9STRA|nr:hypothetical protein TrST_g11514 [Triparma strigata]
MTGDRNSNTSNASGNAGSNWGAPTSFGSAFDSNSGEQKVQANTNVNMNAGYPRDYFNSGTQQASTTTPSHHQTSNSVSVFSASPPAIPNIPIVSDGRPQTSYRDDVSLFMKSGTTLSRTTTRTIFLKKWKESTFWVTKKPATLMVFRTEMDFQDWLQNPYHNEKERDYLVKLKVDFLGDIDGKKVKGFNITEVKSKGYSGNDKLLYQVKVEKIYDYGPNIVAAFAHESPTVMADFRDTIAELILVGRNGGASPQGGGNRVKAASGSGPSGIGGGGIGGGGASSFPPPTATAPTPQPSSVSRATQQRKQGGSGGAYNFEQLTLD